LTGAAAVAGISGANAADMALKAPPPPPPVASWAGWYIGGQVGTALVEINRYDAFDGSLDTSYNGKKSTWTGGGQIGFNWQRGAFVYGLEADASTGSKQTFPGDCSCGEYSNRLGWVATVRGRAGIAIQDTFLYITSGVAFGEITTKRFGEGIQYSQSKTRV